jgi:hypothetical protein
MLVVQNRLGGGPAGPGRKGTRWRANFATGQGILALHIADIANIAKIANIYESGIAAPLL